MFSVAVIDNNFNYLEVVTSDNRIIKRPSHGRVCADVFKLISPEAKMYLIPVMNEKGLSNEAKDISNALYEASSKKVDIVVMSIGTTNIFNTSELFESIDKLKRMGILVIASSSNNNNITFPASLPGVIGVREDKTNILNEGEYAILDDRYDGINIVCSIPKFVYKKVGISEFNGKSNSIATQYFASIIYKRFKNKRDIDFSYDNSKKLSLNCYNSQYYYEELLNYKNKEINEIIIGIYGNKKESLLIAKKLSNLFYDRGYCIAIVGDKVEHKPYMYNFCFDYMFHGKKMSKSDKFNFIYRIASVDMIFYVSETYTHFEYEDLSIFVNGIESIEEKAISISANSDYKYINYVVENILNTFNAV